MAEIQNIRINKVEVKLADTDDPVAQKISWNPAKSGGANFKTQKMTVESDKILIEKTAGSILFGMVFVLPGLCALFIGSPWLFYQGDYVPAVFMIVWGSMFGGAGLLMLMGDKKFTFDKSLGAYFFGKNYDQLNELDRKQQGRLKDIHALQLISERINSSSNNGRSSTYTSHELNLVFKDGERLNVMDHGKGDDVEASAKALAEFLNVPIWKAVY